MFYLLSIDTDKMAKFDDVEAYIASNNIRNADYKQITDIIGENKKLSSKKVYINESFINKMIKGGV